MEKRRNRKQERDDGEERKQGNMRQANNGENKKAVDKEWKKRREGETRNARR